MAIRSVLLAFVVQKFHEFGVNVKRIRYNETPCIFCSFANYKHQVLVVKIEFSSENCLNWSFQIELKTKIVHYKSDFRFFFFLGSNLVFDTHSLSRMRFHMRKWKKSNKKCETKNEIFHDKNWYITNCRRKFSFSRHRRNCISLNLSIVKERYEFVIENKTKKRLKHFCE